MLNDLYNNLQRMNRQGGESGHSAHLCIDVEDAVSINTQQRDLVTEAFINLCHLRLSC